MTLQIDTPTPSSLIGVVLLIHKLASETSFLLQNYTAENKDGSKSFPLGSRVQK
jgi:hypothetical protein